MTSPTEATEGAVAPVVAYRMSPGVLSAPRTLLAVAEPLRSTQVPDAFAPTQVDALHEDAPEGVVSAVISWDEITSTLDVVFGGDEFGVDSERLQVLELTNSIHLIVDSHELERVVAVSVTDVSRDTEGRDAALLRGLLGPHVWTGVSSRLQAGTGTTELELSRSIWVSLCRERWSELRLASFPRGGAIPQGEPAPLSSEWARGSSPAGLLVCLNRSPDLGPVPIDHEPPNDVVHASALPRELAEYANVRSGCAIRIEGNRLSATCDLRDRGHPPLLSLALAYPAIGSGDPALFVPDGGIATATIEVPEPGALRTVRRLVLVFEPVVV